MANVLQSSHVFLGDACECELDSESTPRTHNASCAYGCDLDSGTGTTYSMVIQNKHAFPAPCSRQVTNITYWLKSTVTAGLPGFE